VPGLWTSAAGSLSWRAAKRRPCPVQPRQSIRRPTLEGVREVADHLHTEMLAARIVWRTRCSLVGMPWIPSLQQAGRRVPGAAPGPPWSAAELAPLTLRDSTMAVQARCGSAAAKTKPTPATKRPSAIHVGSMAHLILQEGTLKQQSSRTVVVPGLQKKSRPAPATRMRSECGAAGGAQANVFE
jgi:hypothetical protein